MGNWVMGKGDCLQGRVIGLLRGGLEWLGRTVSEF